MLEVQTEALGLSSQEVEQYVTVPLENNLLDGIMNVWDVRSHSIPGLSSVDLYFERLQLKQLFCEPHAYNIAPNRALQKAGFRYLKTYKTVPGPMNYHQAVTRWMIER